MYALELCFFEMYADPVRMARYASVTIPGVFLWRV